MTPDYATFSVLYPELLTATNQAQITLLLQQTSEEFTTGGWGKCWAAGVLMYVAHLVALANARAASTGADGVVQATGVLVSGSEEGISFSFADPTAGINDAGTRWLLQTPYGAQFIAKRRACLPKAYLSW